MSSSPRLAQRLHDGAEGADAGHDEPAASWISRDRR
jgi:hypothetical protein